VTPLLFVESLTTVVSGQLVRQHTAGI